MGKSYNPCDDCKYGIERRDGSGDDSMCRICEFKAMSNAINNSIKILQTVDWVGSGARARIQEAIELLT